MGDYQGVCMMNEVLLYTGSAVSIIWGIAHLAPTKSVVKGFGEVSADNRRIITMEWLAEGFTLIFIGLLVLLITALYDYSNSISLLVYRVSAGMLLVMATLTALTGARTNRLGLPERSRARSCRPCPAISLSPR